MSIFSRFAVATALVAGFGGLAHAQSQSREAQSAPDGYYALTEGRSVVVDRAVDASGVVAPSESQTVMGLRVPR